MAAQRDSLSVIRSRGLPRRVKRFKLRRFTAHIQPRLHSDEEPLHHLRYQSQNLLGSELVSQMPARTRRNRRPWERRLNPEQERIIPFCAAKNDLLRIDNVWVQFPRVLLSTALERSYMSAERLDKLKVPWTRCNVWKFQTHFGSMEAVGYTEILVTTEPHSWHKVFRITVLVLPDPPLPGGVDFIIGRLDLEAAYGGFWKPKWREQQYAEHSTGQGHDTLIENNNLLSNNYQGPVCPPYSG